MSWDAKKEYCGLSIANKLLVKGSTENRAGQYLEKTGEHGDIVATKPFATNNASPSNEYVIADDISFTAGQISLGRVTTVDSKKYMLQSVNISTGSATEPTFSANAVQVEDGATTDNIFSVPAFSLSVDDIAQILFSAFQLTGSGCEVTQCNAEISCNVNLHAKNGDPVASDVNTGHIKVDATILQSDTSSPNVTATSGWDISSPLSCEDPDSDLPTWKVSLSKPLSKTTQTGN